ncbi:uncharacterized protein LOC129593604 [Paramacrobiotus metropolitanus]|uniref:uncharacterized protein LOC129593604 n=1 Tax=Paramacrobiotus metropolitanus TaxID=2943436 RepID=UPI0024465A24|nr:uncharacterized protein LOC129593604 [Paramacrobiotus metropolitanus]
MKLVWVIWIYFLMIMVHSTTGGIPGVKQLQSLFKSARRMLAPHGGGRQRQVPRAPITFTRRTLPTTIPPQTTPVIVALAGAESAFSKSDLGAATKGSKALPEAPGPASDLLGQLAITFGNADEDDGPATDTADRSASLSDSGDASGRLLNMLPVIFSVAKPVVQNFKGNENYGDLMVLLQDAKEIVSNREVIRRLNEFLDELIGGNDSQTPPTPSDSSLNSLAQIAQNMESIFNTPPQRQRQIPKRGSKEFSNDNYIPGINVNVNEYQKSL